MATFSETVLVTGVTRGIGSELLRQLLERKDTRIIAAVRDLTSEASQRLIELAAATTPAGRLIVVQINSESDTDAREAADTLKTEHGVDSIDLVISNAGVLGEIQAASAVRPDDFRRTVNVNVVAPMLLFQALQPLLAHPSSSSSSSPADAREKKDPRFLLVSTVVASKAVAPRLGYLSTTYGASKAALNYVGVRLALEHPGVATVLLHPGLVQTDMAAAAQRSVGGDIDDEVAQGKAITATQSARAILKLADEATIATHSGKFLDAPTGEQIPW